MDNQEVNELIEKLYYKEHNGEKGFGKLENMFETIDADATTIVSVNKSDSTSSSYMKKTLLITQSSDRPYMAHIRYVCTWLVMPQYRYVDSLTVTYTDYAILNRTTDNNISMQASYNEQEVYASYVNGDITVLSSQRKYMDIIDSVTGNNNMSLNIITDNVNDGKNSEIVSLLVKLPDDGPTVWVGKDYKQVVCTDLQITFGFFIEATGRRKIDIAASYLHTYTKVDGAQIAATSASWTTAVIGLLLPSNWNVAGAILNIINVSNTVYVSVTSNYSNRVGNFVGEPITGSFYMTKVK